MGIVPLLYPLQVVAGEEAVSDAMLARAGIGCEKSRERLFLFADISRGDCHMLRVTPFAAEAGDDLWATIASTWSIDCFSQPFWTLTIAYVKRVFNSLDN
jgi:hypothetical protein